MVSASTAGIARARNADPVTQAPAPGFDLLAAFPPADRVGIAGDLRTRAIDVIEDDEIALGTDVTYRVASLDVIGRLPSTEETRSFMPIAFSERSGCPRTRRDDSS